MRLLLKNRYGFGNNELLLSNVLRTRRSEVFLCTKFGFREDEKGEMVLDGRPERVRVAFEASLERLGVDYVVLYYLHRTDPNV